MPKQMVKTTDWEIWIDEDEEDIRLIDFGQAFAHGHEPLKLDQGRRLYLQTKSTIALIYGV